MPDSNFSDVIVLAKFDSFNGDTTFIDSSINEKPGVFYGNAVISTAQQKYGQSSLFLDGDEGFTGGANDDSHVEISPRSGIPTDLDLAGDFTIDFWLRPTSADTRDVLNWGAVGQIYLVRNADGTLYLSFAGSEPTITGTVAINQWTHLAIVRDFDTLYVFINGVEQSSMAGVDGVTIDSDATYLGYLIGSQNFIGYIDNFRATSVARWVANFTPPIETDYVPPGGSGINVTGVSSGLGFTGYTGLFALAKGVLSGFGFTSYAATATHGHEIVWLQFNNNTGNFDPIPGTSLGFTGYPGQLLYFVNIKRKEIIGRKFYCYLGTASSNFADAIEIPISSINGYYRSSLQASFTAVCPDGINYLSKILANINKSMKIKAVEIYSDGTQEEKLAMSVGNLQLTYDRGARSFSVSLSGTSAFLEQVPHKKISLDNNTFFVESLQANGLRRFRIPYSPDIYPGDIIVYNNVETVIGRVTHTVGSTGMTLELTEEG